MIYPTYTEPGFNAAALALSRARGRVIVARHYWRVRLDISSLIRLGDARAHLLHCENIVALKLYRPRADPVSAYRFAGLI